MDLELLRTFHTVVQRQGMRRAADALHRSQPAISARIRELERVLDLRVFERRGRRLHLTSAGRLLLEESRGLLAASEALQRRLAPLRGLRRGTLRLATIDAVSIYLLPEIYLEFRRSHPEVELLVQVVDSRRVLASVRRRRVDLGFVALADQSRVSPDPALDVVPFFEDTMVCVGSPSHPLSAVRRLELATVAAEPLVLYSRGSHTRATLDAVFHARRITPNVAMETESPEAMKRLAEVGVGLAILPLGQVQAEITAGRLCRLDTVDARFARTLATVTRRGRALEPAAVRFLELLFERFPPLGSRKRNRDPSDDGSRSRNRARAARS